MFAKRKLDQLTRHALSGVHRFNPRTDSGFRKKKMAEKQMTARAVPVIMPKAEIPADVQTVARWDSIGYGGDAMNSGSFVMEVNDQRESAGQLFIDVAPESGNVDEILTVGVEIAVDPRTLSDTPCVRISASGDEVSINVYQLGDQLLIVPGNGQPFSPVRLADGSFGFTTATP